MHFPPACFPLCKLGTILAAPLQGSWVPVKREAPLSPQPGPRVRAPESGHAGALCCAQPGPGAGPRWALRGLLRVRELGEYLRQLENESIDSTLRTFVWKEASPQREPPPRRLEVPPLLRPPACGERPMWALDRPEGVPAGARAPDPDQLEGPKVPSSALPPQWLERATSRRLDSQPQLPHP